jgi:chromosome segregation ATPase
MEGTNFTPSDSAILLLNEIDILLAQTRLMELYLKQAQATGANEAACIEQQHQAELGLLRAALFEKDRAALQQAANAAQQENFAERIRQLEVLLDTKQSQLLSREGDLEAARDEIIALQRQVADLETAQQQAQAVTLEATTQRASLQSELAALGQQFDLDQRNFHQKLLDADQLERELRAQLAQLQMPLAEKRAWQQNASELTDPLGAKINELQLQLAEKQLLVDSRSAEIGDLKDLHSRLLTQLAKVESAQRQSSDLLQEIEQSRSARQNEIAALTEAHRTELCRLENELTQERDALAAEADALRQELQQKSWAMAQERATAEELASAYRAQIGEVDAKLTDLRGGAGIGDENLKKQHELARALQHRVDELELELLHAELTAVSRAEQIRQESAAQIDVLNIALKQKSQNSIAFEEQGKAQSSLEQSLRHEVDRLLREVEERNQILQNRNDELVRVKADLDSYQDRFNQMAASVSLTETAASSEVESVRSEFQAQLALLQAELSQKDWALDERHATVEGLAQEHRQEIESLRRQLREKLSASDSSSGAVSIDAANITAQAHGRRWHGGFAAKRRWKV